LARNSALAFLSCMHSAPPSLCSATLPADGLGCYKFTCKFHKMLTVINFIRFTNTVPLIFFYSLNPFHHLIAQKVMDFSKKERLITINPVALSLLDAQLMKLIFLQDLDRKSFPKEKKIMFNMLLTCNAATVLFLFFGCPSRGL